MHEVGIIMRNGKITDVFSEDQRSVRKGMFRRDQVRTFIASTASFRLAFWLKDPDDPSEPGEGIALDQPVLTADGQLVTGWIGMTFSVIPERVYLLLQLLGSRSAVRTSDVADAVKGDLLAKVLAMDVHRRTADDLRGNRDLFRGIYSSLETELLPATIAGYGLRLDNFHVHWGLTPEERERIKDQRHDINIRDIERVLELEDAKKPKEPAEPEPQPSLPPPTPPPGPPVSQADQIRRYALEHFVEPARREGRRSVEIRLGDVQLGLGVRTNVPNFINALSGRKFLEMADLRLLETSGAAAAPNTVFHYEILGHPDPTVQNEQSYWVYTDQITSKSTIHEESCWYYQNRSNTRRSDNWWHGLYASKEQAASSPENVGQVRECGTCCP